MARKKSGAQKPASALSVLVVLIRVFDGLSPTQGNETDFEVSMELFWVRAKVGWPLVIQDRICV